MPKIWSGVAPAGIFERSIPSIFPDVTASEGLDIIFSIPETATNALPITGLILLISCESILFKT